MSDTLWDSDMGLECIRKTMSVRTTRNIRRPRKWKRSHSRSSPSGLCRQCPTAAENSSTRNLSEAILIENDVVIAFKKQLTLWEETKRDQPPKFLAEKMNWSKENANFQFLSDTLIESEAKRNCEIWNVLNCIICQISLKDATAAMRILLKRNNIATRHVDDQFLVTACQPVKPEKFLLNYQATEKC